VVERIRFAEGNVAGANQVLVEIEPQRYRLAVESARAALEKAKAGLADAQAGLERREKAVVGTPGLIPGEEIETWRTRLRTAEAEVAERQAAFAEASLNLHDAYVRTPVAGTIESRKVETGQFVQPGAVLATLVRRDPLLLRFSVPSGEASELRPGMVARFKTQAAEGQPGSARITYVAQGADPNTRMVAVTAHVALEPKASKGRKEPQATPFRPGAFAQVTVPVGGTRESPVLPQTAVRPTERGFVAFIVEKGLARERVLTLGLRTPEGDIEVKGGVRPGEQVVIRGAEALRDGAAVNVQSSKDPSSASSTTPGASPGTLAP
jgi:membrane fusion protein, multidrug efflux system